MKPVTAFILFFFVLVPAVYGQAKLKHTYHSFGEFYSAFNPNCEPIPSAIKLTDTISTSKRISANIIRQTFSFKLEDLRIKYVVYKDTDDFPTYYDSSYITLNERLVLPDTNHPYIGLAIRDAEKIVLNGTTYFILHSFIRPCNGSFCRAMFDQFFQIRNGEVSYQIVEGWQGPANTYCDINNDGQLDQISFVGDCSINGDSLLSVIDSAFYEKAIKTDSDGMQQMRNYFCIHALTLKDNKWISSTDRNKKEYFIYIEVDDFLDLDSFKVLDYNWMTDL